ncbi:methylated-DNA--protein-cysteine methyltransferase [Sorangium cellulosum]|uniref:Methylated-DNA--protein-cysteine methyltransferase n=1 Tax=Sorangium cellulosum TaxID=56 RepID=A0A4P2Q6M6_SORCE|nr:methylated-DNA--[protein]-cysteine S-methyltransferase [Sorangium cellulosum]AUX25080.1 methylated-DNA--protein-cysteine methyltransferase [Sorangium cellulosum]
MELLLDEVESPIGGLLLVASGGAIHALDFADCAPRLRGHLAARHGAVALRRAADPHGFSGRLRAYFGGDLGALSGIPVEPGGTPFQRRVWAELQRIPPGATRTYGEIAASLGRSSASRAVGLANGRNPISVIIPCHRVLGASGALTGYAGGLERKRWLLAHEGAAGAAPGSGPR